MVCLGPNTQIFRHKVPMCSQCCSKKKSEFRDENKNKKYRNGAILKLRLAYGRRSNKQEFVICVMDLTRILSNTGGNPTRKYTKTFCPIWRSCMTYIHTSGTSPGYPHESTALREPHECCSGKFSLPRETKNVDQRSFLGVSVTSLYQRQAFGSWANVMQPFVTWVHEFVIIM